MSLSQKNTRAVQDIESAILLVCLDDTPPPSTDTARAWTYWAGGHDRSGKGKGFNRWFDKHEFIVDANGESGFNGERKSHILCIDEGDELIVRFDAGWNAYFAIERIRTGWSR